MKSRHFQKAKMSKKNKLSRKEAKRIAILKAKYAEQMAKAHCPEWGFMKGTCKDTMQCAKCFIVTEGPENCVGCEAEFSDLEERKRRECPHLLGNRQPVEKQLAKAQAYKEWLRIF